MNFVYDADYHRATLDSVRRRLPHPERYRLVLAALLTYALANDNSPELQYRIFQVAMAAVCFFAVCWLLVDYTSVLLRAGIALGTFVLLFSPAIDPSSDLDLQIGFVAVVAAATVGGLTAILDRATGHTDVAGGS